MVDLVGIGVSGLAAYQRALATTGNNIANLQTAGYVRQRVTLQPAGQDNSARISLGSGVRFAGVERLYDKYLEENLQRSGGDLKSQQALLGELQQLQDALGSSAAGLHGAFESFFSASKALEASPSSTGARSGFLAAAEGVASRFRGLSATASDLESATRQSINQSVDEINVRLKEVSTLNAQLIKRSSDADQPMQLLDRRDALLKELSERLGVTVQLSQSGAANIYAGDSASGAALVEAGTAHLLSANFDAVDPGRVQLVLDAASRPMVLPTPVTGTVGGLVTFRGQGLGPAQDKLDTLAKAFGSTLNAINRGGVDGVGQPGKDIFYIGPKFSVEGNANSGSSRLDVKIIDPSQVRAQSYAATYDAVSSQWTIRNLSTGDSVRGAERIQIDGLAFNFQGAARAGDSFRIAPDARPASTFSVLLKEPAEIATASPLSVSVAMSNISSTSADVAMRKPPLLAAVRNLSEVLQKSDAPPFSTTYFSATPAPVAFIAAGTSGVNLHALGSGSTLAVFTRDGRQLSGPTIAATAAANIVSVANGFNVGAKFSASYKDQIGSAAYLDHSFGFGVTAAGVATLDDHGQPLEAFAYVDSAPILAPTFSGIPANALLLNGVSIDAPLPAGASAARIAQILDSQSLRTGVSVKAVSEVSCAIPNNIPSGSSQSLTINGNTFSAADVNSLIAAINAAASGALPNISARLDSTGLVIADSSGADLAVSGIIGSVRVGQSGAVGAHLQLRSLKTNTDFSVDIDPQSFSSVDGVAALRELGLNAGFQVKPPLARIESRPIIAASFAGIPTNVLRLNGVAVNAALPAGASGAQIAQKLDAQRNTTGVAVTAVSDVTLEVPQKLPAGTTQSLTINGTTFSAADVSTLLADINTAAAGGSASVANVSARWEASGVVISDSTGADLAVSGSIGGVTVGQPGAIGARLQFRSLTVGNDVSVDIDGQADPTLDSAAALRQLGLTPGFQMKTPLAEDLLVFGVDAQGSPAPINLAGTYQTSPPSAQSPPPMGTYQLTFAQDNNFQVIDTHTGTVVSEGQMDPGARTISYANWSLQLSGLPAAGDTYTIAPTADPLGDNRNAAQMSALQARKDLTGTSATLQEDYEALVNRIGALSVQAEVSKNAQQVVFDHAVSARDSVSGVNLDEELADLLRFQQAYQANAQVIQAANKLFDSLMQRL